MRQSLSILFFTFLSVFAWGQTDVNMITGTYTSCGGGFFDSQGQGGGGYLDNEYAVVTICPENEGEVVGVDFTFFNLSQEGPENTWDYLAIYDGENTNANGLGFYTGTSLQGTFVSASPLNPSGCLTFVFESNNVGTGSFVGIITCETPCDRPVVVASDDAPATRRVCVGDEITFDGSASFAADGFNIIEYNWDFDDGTNDTSGPIVSHVFDEPGEYVVELYLTDDNGCSSANLANLQLLVATPPSWEDFPSDQDLCLGEEFSAQVDPDFFEITWSGAQDSFENPEDIFLEDVIGAPYESEIFVNAFEPGQTLTDVEDLLNITVNMNHSWLYDLFISVSCPSGESVILHNQWNLAGGLETGTNGTNLGIPDQEFFEYSWTNDPEYATWAEEAEGIGTPEIPAGSYASVDPLDGLVGCELNGTWTIQIIDFWGGDDGDLDNWSIGFDPSIFPDVTEFTPDIGLGADSSFWTFPVGGPDPYNLDLEGNNFTILPDEEGTWDYTFTAINNHGCSYDSTITITVEEALQADAGEDMTWCGPGTTLLGGFQDIPSPLCSSDGGNYDYCYTDNENSVFTYCPDNPGDGITFMSIVFNSGEIENFFDEITFYDGDDITAPIIDQVDGDLTGLSFTATNPDGCITMQITSDFTVSCTGGFIDPLNYDVVCNLGGPDYTYEWVPATGLSDPTILNPTVDEITEPTTYTLTVYPDTRPECSSTDEMVISPAFVYTFDFEAPICFEPDGSITVEVDPDSGDGPWTLSIEEGGEIVDEITYDGGVHVFDNLFPGFYVLEITDGVCSREEIIVIDAPPNITLTAPQDTTICYEGMATLTVEPSEDPGDLEYFWSNGGTGQTLEFQTLQDSILTVFGTYSAGCYTDTVQVGVFVLEPLSMSISDGDTICLGDSILVAASNISGGLEPYTFEWSVDAGGVIEQQSAYVFPEYTANWCCTMDDACETPPNVQCIEIVISDPVDPGFVADTLGGCVPVTIGFSGVADNPEFIAESVWEFGDGSFSSLDQQVFHTYESQGVYTVTHSIVTNFGCFFEQTEEDLINIFNQPIAGFDVEPQTAVLPNTAMDFINYSLGAEDYIWVMNETDSLTEEDPTYQFPAFPGSYPVTLYAANEWGCVDSLSRSVFVVDEFVMYVPNVFTPDFDGINDRFYFEGIDVDKDDFTLQIFDRWGEVVFTSTTFEEGWDGSYNRRSHFVPDGIYVYRIETRSLTTEERKEIVGHVLITR